jgi:hypothetical protein
MSWTIRVTWWRPVRRLALLSMLDHRPRSSTLVVDVVAAGVAAEEDDHLDLDGLTDELHDVPEVRLLPARQVIE